MDKHIVIATIKSASLLTKNLIETEALDDELNKVIDTLKDIDWSLITKFSIDWKIVKDAKGYILDVLPKINIESDTTDNNNLSKND